MRDGRDAPSSIHLTTTATTTTSRPPQQLLLQQLQNAFQRWSSTSSDNDRHHSDIHSSFRGTGGPATIRTLRESYFDEYDHYDQLMTDEDTVEQRQTSPDHYQGLDPAFLPTLRQPQEPREYARLTQPI